MAKISNFALKIKRGVVGRLAHAKYSDTAIPQNLKLALTIQEQMVKIPLQSPGKLSIFLAFSLFFYLSLSKI